MANKSPVERQAISNPAGGGDMRGLGETFQPDLNSGVGNYRVPLDLLPGIRNFQPSLALGYSTGASNSPWGLGWSLPFATISRRTFRGTPSYTEEDTFLFAGQTELVPLGPDTFRASVENGFEQFNRTETGWQVTEKSGIRHTFGTTAESRIEFDDNGTVRMFAWLVERTEDTTGNAITYRYRSEQGQRYIEEIRYAIYVIRFEYEVRPDAFSDFRSGFEQRTTLRCTQITLHVEPLGPAAVRSWSLAYDLAPLSGLSLLRSVTFSGNDPEMGESASLPPLQFSYTEFTPSSRRLRKFTAAMGAAPPGLDQPNLELIDLDGRGLPGVLSIENGIARYWSNTGQLRWAPPRSLPQFPAVFSTAEDRVQFADMDGNGAADVLVGSGTLSGFYRNEGTGAFDEFNRYARSPQLAFETGGLQLMDVNGDGLVDAVHDGRTGLQVYNNRGATGWEPPRLVPKADLPTPVPNLSSGDPRVRLADMNGDKIPDVVLFSSGYFEYWPSRGGGHFSESRKMSSAPRFPYPFDPARVFITDINGDGLADVVFVGYDEVTYWINQSGNAFSPPQTIRYTPPTSRADTLRIADMSGTGTGGILWTSPYPDYRYLDFTGDVKPGLLGRIDNGLGRVTTIEYATSTAEARRDQEQGQAWTSFLPFPVQVVSAVTIDDSISGLHNVTRYRYHEGHYDGYRREFDGFGRSEQIEEGDASIPSCRTVFHYHTEASGKPSEPDPELRRSLKRKLFRVEVFGEDASPLASAPYRVEESRWIVRIEQTLPDGRRVLFPFVEETVTSTFERQSAARIERRMFSFDASGNVTGEERRGEGGEGVPLLATTRAEYAQDPTGRIRDRVSRIVQRDGDGNLLNELRHYYDGPAFEGLPLGQVSKGLLTRTEKVALHKSTATSVYGAHEPDLPALGYRDGEDQDGEPAWLYDHKRLSLDERGNVLISRDARGNDTTYTFDEFGLFATSIIDAKGFIATVEHDLRVARPRRMVNPNGGVTESRYDPLARIAVVAVPGDTLAIPSVTYSYETSVLPALRSTRYRVISGDSRTIAVNEYLDGVGALYQRRTEHDGAMVSVSGQAVTNARGKMAEKLESFYAEGLEFEPYPADPSAPRRRFFFDALGRAIRTVHPDGGESSAEYRPFDTLFSDGGDNDPAAEVSFGTPRRELYDSWYRLVGVEERDQSTVRMTRYGLDGAGRLRQITDPRGIILSRLTRDLTGQEIGIEHVDAGNRLLAYDASGNLALQVDAAGESINRTYDELNRITATAYGGVEPEQYFYDAGSGANLTGRLVRTVDPAGETAYSYDERGNVTLRSRLAPGQTEALALNYTFDRIGRMIRVGYPDGAIVDFEHYSGFLLRRIPGIVDTIEYTAAGVRTALQYENGVRTEYGYDPASLRLRELRTHRPETGAVYFHTRYDIDKVGNVAAIEDLRAAAAGFVRTQSFGYDAFNNLLEASSPDPTAGYSHVYEYDQAANFLRNPLISSNPLFYENGGNSNRLSGHNDGINAVTLFGYDANGNVTSMPGRTLTFDAKQQLSRVQVAGGADVVFFYDHKGVLSRREATLGGSTETTHYMDNLFESRGSPGSGSTQRWILAGDLPVACVADGTTVFIHNDHLGSAVIYTDAGGNLLTETAFHPFGSVIMTPSGALPPAFATKKLDADIGLYYFNARWYSPLMGRFISPDPLYLYQPEQGLQEPKRLNPYAYAGNNPVRYVDPSGLGFWDVLGAIVIAIAVVVAVIAVSVLTFGVGTAIGFGTLLAYAAVAGLAGAAIGAVVGGIAYGSWEGALRGALIGFTAGANAMIGGMIFGPIIGAALGIITFLAVIPPVAKSDVYQGILGWTSYLMPMSWPGHAIGLVLFALNVVGYLVTFGQVDRLRIRDMQVDWKTGNIFTVGGWVGQLDGRAFNFGAFSFVNTARYVGGEIIPATFEHESGHMLSNAAFGFFQATRVFEGNGLDSFWERIAESNVPPGLRGTDPVTPEPDRPKIPQWG